jgi:hypothetical protein
MRWILVIQAFVCLVPHGFTGTVAKQVSRLSYHESVQPHEGFREWIYPKWQHEHLAMVTFPGQRSQFLPSWSAMALRRIGAVRGLAALHRDLALLCQESSIPSDISSALPNCELSMVDPNGNLHRLGRQDLLAAQRLPGNRSLLWTRDLKLMVRDSNGMEVIHGEAVAVPRVSEEGWHVVYTQFAKGITQLVPGMVGVLKIQHLGSGKTATVTADPTASSPFPVPGSLDVLFLSVRTGLASIWLASPGKPDRQITNIDQLQVGPQFIPVYGQEKVWIPGTQKLIYTASYESKALWSLDVATGKTQRLGKGRLPQLAADGSIIALDDSRPMSSSIIRYSLDSIR